MHWNACILAVADYQYRTGGHDDYFGLEDYRKIVYASRPDPREEEFDLEPHNNISHLTAHQLAFVEIKASAVTPTKSVQAGKIMLGPPVLM